MGINTGGTESEEVFGFFRYRPKRSNDEIGNEGNEFALELINSLMNYGSTDISQILISYRLEGHLSYEYSA